MSEINTEKKDQQSRPARAWLCTLNNPTKHYPTTTPNEYLYNWFKTDKFAYVNGQLEQGEAGTVHLQFYLACKKPQRKSALIKHCKYAAYTPVKVDNGASVYCLKEDTRLEGPWEFGIKPVQKSRKTDWEEVWQKAKAGKLEELPANIRVTHYNKLKMIGKDFVQVTGEVDQPKGIWIHGETGLGKSHFARQTWPDHYAKLANKWFDGY